jgi:predicted RNA-binding Zn ribbon-like protein
MSKVRTIRFGGLETPDGFLFELSGGAVPLDFVNTLDERPRGGRERLTDYRELIRWAEQVGLLTEQGAAHFLAAAFENPREAGRIHTEALGLREVIFATIKAGTAGSILSDGDVQHWNAWLDRIRKGRWISAGPRGLEWQVSDYGAQMDGVVHAVAEAAIELFLNSSDRPRLRVCAADDCDWAFLDTTRRQNRVWCDMTVCGNRAKAARHYRLKTGK